MMSADQGPMPTAQAWVRAVLIEGDLSAAWELTAEPLRRRLAEQWATLAAEHLVRSAAEQLATWVLAGPNVEPAWEPFASSVIDSFQYDFSHVDLKRWRYLPRGIAGGRAVVLLVDASERDLSLDLQALPAVHFGLLLEGDVWRVAAIG